MGSQLTDRERGRNREHRGDHRGGPRGGRAALVVALLFFAAVAVGLLVWSRLRRDAGPSGAGGARAAQEQDQLARELAAAWFAKAVSEEQSLVKAQEALGPLLARDPPAAEDMVREGIIEVELANTHALEYEAHLKKAREWFDRALALAPDDAASNYVLGQLELSEGRMERAIPYLRKAAAAAPDDVPTSLALAAALEDTNPEEAEQLYRRILKLGVDFAGSWYMAALYRLATAIGPEPARAKEFEQLLLEHSRLRDRGLESPDPPEIRRGNLGRLLPPPVVGGKSVHPLPPSPLGPDVRIAEAPGGLERLRASDLDGDGKLDLFAVGPGGLWIALQREGGAWEQRKFLEGARIELAVALDLTNDSDAKRNPQSRLDLVVAVGGELRLLRASQGADAPAWRPLDAPIASLPGAPSDLLAVDFDHEGDLDLLAVGPLGTRLLRNDGASTLGSAQPKGGFTDVTTDANLPPLRAASWCAVEDFDNDQDVDLLFGNERGVQVASNLRGGHFEDLSERFAAVGPTPRRPVLADFDGDARVDLWNPLGTVQLFLNQPSARLKAIEGSQLAPLRGDGAPSAPPPADQDVVAVDLDGDSSCDACWMRTENGASWLEGQLALGLREQQGFRLPIDGPASAAPAVLADFDGDCALDLARATEDGVHLNFGKQRASGAVALTLRGLKDNRRGVGAIVELRSPQTYQRVFWKGETEVLGVGTSPEIHWLRITWPNGVTQHDLEKGLGPRTVHQIPGLIGSCPFLYTWNGSRYEFVTDVLGITPLGLPMAPGMLVPPDHDEYVLIRGEQLAAKDGQLEVQLTEELREVTYLDRARLDVVDHPADTEIFPNELFCFPPFPEAHTHTVKHPLAPSRALGSDGKDWRQALAAIDDDYAAPFEPAPPQYQGLATPHWLELEFPREGVANARLLRLVMTGWFFWTDASVNMAAARSGEYEFLPPLFQIPDGQGGWKAPRQPVGFPAGKTKTMVIDVTDLLPRDDPRLRIVSTLRLYWDSIRLATDADDAELRTESLEPSSAVLWRRGFSAPLFTALPNQPERFEWEHLAEIPRWNPHPGLYTRYGETVPLLGVVDDEFVIMGAGDALTVGFDASALPPVAPGFRRDYLLFLDGWAKDRDPNTLEAEHVEPLPFHGMSGYPYGRLERFPEDEAHRKWRVEWNTRVAERWMPRVLGGLGGVEGGSDLAR
jgi:tetratricopeptide (TPR) repeat protein